MMWTASEDDIAAADDEESSCSSEDEGDIQVVILEKQRDEANEKLSELEQVSSQLLREVDALEMHFQIERTCRESAEALAVKVTRENKFLKRTSQMLMPLIPEMPEDMASLTFDLGTDSGGDGPGAEEEDSSEEGLLSGQAQINELQASVDRLLGEKLQQEEQVEALRSELDQLREQLALEIDEKETILKKLTKQNKTMTKIKRVSQLVTEEFSEMSQKLNLEQGLRQHAEVFAHQVLMKQKEVQRQSVVLTQASETSQQLQQALEQVANINTTLQKIHLHHQDQVQQTQSVLDETNLLAELQDVRSQLVRSEEEKRAMLTQLENAHSTVANLQREVKQLQDRLKAEDKPDQSVDGEQKLNPPPTPPPPPPPPPPPSSTADPLDVLRRRRKDLANNTDTSKLPVPLVDMKSKAVDEMMDRIKKGIVLRPIVKPQLGPEEEMSWRDQRNEKRKSAVLDLKGMLGNIKCQTRRRASSKRRISRKVGEAELQLVLQRRRRALGDAQEKDTLESSAKTQDPQPGSPATGASPWALKNSTVLRKLQQNREKRDSRIRESVHIVTQGN